MNHQVKASQPLLVPGGFLSRAWKHRLWWLLPLGVLLLLLGVIYALEHLSSADSEMYPTSSRNYFSLSRPC
jgi:hypothetical protein